MGCSPPGIWLVLEQYLALTIIGDIYTKEHMKTIPSPSKKPHQSPSTATGKGLQVSSSITWNSTNYRYSGTGSSLFSNPRGLGYEQGSVTHTLLGISLTQSFHLNKQLSSAGLGAGGDRACISGRKTREGQHSRLRFQRRGLIPISKPSTSKEKSTPLPKLRQ